MARGAAAEPKTLIDIYALAVKACDDTSAALVPLPTDTTTELPGVYKRDICLSLLRVWGQIKEDLGANGADVIKQLQGLGKIPSSANDAALEEALHEALDALVVIEDFTHQLTYAYKRVDRVWQRYTTHFDESASGTATSILPPPKRGLLSRIFLRKGKVPKEVPLRSEPRDRFSEAVRLVTEQIEALKAFWRSQSSEIYGLLEPPRNRGALWSYARQWEGLDAPILAESRKIGAYIYRGYTGYDPPISRFMLYHDRYDDAVKAGAKQEPVDKGTSKSKKSLKSRRSVPFFRKASKPQQTTQEAGKQPAPDAGAGELSAEPSPSASAAAAGDTGIAAAAASTSGQASGHEPDQPVDSASSDERGTSDETPVPSNNLERRGPQIEELESEPPSAKPEATSTPSTPKSPAHHETVAASSEPRGEPAADAASSEEAPIAAVAGDEATRPKVNGDAGVALGTSELDQHPSNEAAKAAHEPRQDEPVNSTAEAAVQPASADSEPASQPDPTTAPSTKPVSTAKPDVEPASAQYAVRGPSNLAPSASPAEPFSTPVIEYSRSYALYAEGKELDEEEAGPKEEETTKTPASLAPLKMDNQAPDSTEHAKLATPVSPNGAPSKASSIAASSTVPESSRAATPPGGWDDAWED